MKFILLLTALLTTPVYATISCSPQNGGSMPYVTFEEVLGHIDQPILSELAFELNKHIGASYSQVVAAEGRTPNTWIFDISTLGMYDKSELEISKDYFFTDFVGAAGFPASIIVDISGSAGPKIIDVLCIFK